MALITCNFFSHALDISTAVHVILPQQGVWSDGLLGKRWPTLWLLHGLSDDHTIWQRRTAIERYVESLPLAVVMPAVNRSFYADMVHGAKYWTYVSEELPALMRHWFPLSAAREDNYVAGLSMGGYGALKLALNHPDRFAAAASLSGALNFPQFALVDPQVERTVELIFGGAEKYAGSSADLWERARLLVESGLDQPRLYAMCGTDDFLYQQNIEFRDYAAQIGLEMTFEECPGGHTWDVWDRTIARVIAWMGLGEPLPA